MTTAFVTSRVPQSKDLRTASTARNVPAPPLSHDSNEINVRPLGRARVFGHTPHGHRHPRNANARRMHCRTRARTHVRRN